MSTLRCLLVAALVCLFSAAASSGALAKERLSTAAMQQVQGGELFEDMYCNAEYEGACADYQAYAQPCTNYDWYDEELGIWFHSFFIGVMPYGPKCRPTSAQLACEYIGDEFPCIIQWRFTGYDCQSGGSPIAGGIIMKCQTIENP